MGITRIEFEEPPTVELTPKELEFYNFLRVENGRSRLKRGLDQPLFATITKDEARDYHLAELEEGPPRLIKPNGSIIPNKSLRIVGELRKKYGLNYNESVEIIGETIRYKGQP